LLIIEDSERLQRSLGLGLRGAGYAVDIAGNGAEGLWRATSSEYDVIILDLMLPGINGLSILQQLRKDGIQTHVLILTAKDTIDDKVLGLRTGADDYLVKPFSFEELLARVEALARRKIGKKSPLIAVGPIVLDTSAKTIVCNGCPVALTPREYHLLEYLLLHHHRVISRQEIEQHIYDSLTDLMSNVVDSAVYGLRKKLEPLGGAAFIQTRRGLGYIVEPPHQ
jgi:DNA-binding response OmpR family regulator